MQRVEILNLLSILNEKLSKKEIFAEIGIVGGSAIALAFDERRSTKDVDAIFVPATEVRALAAEMAAEYNLPQDWLNDGVKGFLSQREPQKNEVLNFSHLKVWVPEPEYLLAMKAMSARVDTMDKDDLILIINHLGITTVDGVLTILRNYYPAQHINVKTQYFLEELFESL